MESINDKYKIQMDGIIRDFSKMNSLEKYNGILFKLGNVDAFICREEYEFERKQTNFIFNLNKTIENGDEFGGTFTSADENLLSSVLIPIEKVKPFISPNLKLFPVHWCDNQVWMKPCNSFSNKCMKTKKDREFLSRHLCRVLGFEIPAPIEETEDVY